MKATTTTPEARADAEALYTRIEELEMKVELQDAVIQSLKKEVMEQAKALRERSTTPAPSAEAKPPANATQRSPNVRLLRANLKIHFS